MPDKLERNYDLVVVGAGIAGLCLACVMCSKGYSVLVLEKTSEYKEVLRGDWTAPWGVKELMSLGLHDKVVRQGVFISKHIGYDQLLLESESVDSNICLDSVILGVKGALGIRYEKMREILYSIAQDAGCIIIHGANFVDCYENNKFQKIKFINNDKSFNVSCKIIVGADGRNSSIRKKMGEELNKAPLHHYYFGLVLNEVSGLKYKNQFSSIGNKVSVVSNPVDNNSVRVYMNVDPENYKEFKKRGFLDSFLSSLKMNLDAEIEYILSGIPASRCMCMPNSATWVNSPVKNGVILLGDAAGSDDPITGQGISSALRDVRIVSEILTHNSNWNERKIFSSYTNEKIEGMRRLRFTSTAVAVRDADFTDDAVKRREKIYEVIDKNPEIGMPLWSQYIGPEKLPCSIFNKKSWDSLFLGLVDYPVENGL